MNIYLKNVQKRINYKSGQKNVELFKKLEFSKRLIIILKINEAILSATQLIFPLKINYFIIYKLKMRKNEPK